MKKKVKPIKIDEERLGDVTNSIKKKLDEQNREAEQSIKDQGEVLLTDTKYNQEQFFSKVSSIKEPLKKIEEQPKQVQQPKPVQQQVRPVRSTQPVKSTQPVTRTQPKPVVNKPEVESKPVKKVGQPKAVQPKTQVKTQPVQSKIQVEPKDTAKVVKPAKPVVKEQPKKVTTKTAPKVQSKVEQKYITWTQKPKWNPNLQDMFDAAKSNTKNINKAATNIQKRTNKINQQQSTTKSGLVKNNTQSNKNDVKSSVKTSTGVQVYTSQQSYKLNLDKLSKKDAFPQVTEKLKQLREIKNKRSLQAGDSKNTNLEAIQDHKKRFNIKTPYWYVDKETNQALYFDGNVSFYRPVYVYNVATGKGKDDTDMYRKWDGDYKRIAKERKNSSGAGVYVVDKVEKGSSYGLKRSGERAYKGSNDGEPAVRLRGVGHGMRVAMAMHASPSPKADKDFELPNSERNTTSGCIRFEVNELRKAYDEGRLFEGDTVYVKPHNKKSYMYEHEGEIKTYLSLNKDVKDKLVKNRIKPKVDKYSKRYKHYNAVLYNNSTYNKK